MSADALLSPGNVASFRMQVSRTTRKVRLCSAQRPCSSLAFHERHGLAFGHRLAAVLTVRSCKRRRESKPDDLAIDDGSRIHDISVRQEHGRNKRGACRRE